MTQTKHTPGPWIAICPVERYFHEGTDITNFSVVTEKTRAEYHDEGRSHYAADPDRVDNINIVSNQFWRDLSDDEAKANAALIAAAPDLLSAADKAILAIITVKNFLMDLADATGIDDERRKEVYRQIDGADRAIIAAIAKAEGSQ